MKKYTLILLILGFIPYAKALTLNFGIWGGSDSRIQVGQASIYGFSAALLWGSKNFQMGFGGHKALQKVNTVVGGYETVTINFQYSGFYLNPFYGYRFIRTSDYFKSNNLYPTQGVVFGYDYLFSKSLSIGVMGIYESPGELASDKINISYVKLKTTLSPAITFKYWW